jgi:hypothetical protein
VRGNRLRATTPLKQRAGLLLDFLLPLAHLNRVNAKLLTDLVDGLDPTQGLQSKPGLEGRQMNFSRLLFTHDFPI